MASKAYGGSDSISGTNNLGNDWTSYRHDSGRDSGYEYHNADGSHYYRQEADESGQGGFSQYDPGSSGKGEGWIAHDDDGPREAAEPQEDTSYNPDEVGFDRFDEGQYDIENEVSETHEPDDGPVEGDLGEYYDGDQYEDGGGVGAGYEDDY